MIRTLPKRSVGVLLALLMLLGSAETAFGAHACTVHDGPGHGGHGSHSPAVESGAHGGDGVNGASHEGPGTTDLPHGPSHSGDPHQDESCTCPGACVIATGVVVPSEHWRSVAPVVLVSTPATPVAAAPANRLHARNFLPYSHAPPVIS